MDLRPAIITAILIPVGVTNIWLTSIGKGGIYFMTWGVFVTVLLLFYSAMCFVESFKELKRRRNG